MANKKCLIAGLPASGKSTYIGALWYNLRHDTDDIDGMKMRSDDNLPKNITTLSSLSDLWKVGTRIDRTNSNATESVQINLEDKETKLKFIVEVPDFLGETFQDILDLKESPKLSEWCEESDVLLYFIEELNHGEFEDDDIYDESETTDEQDVLPPLVSKDMTPDAQNMMILKYLMSNKSFSKVVIVLSQWDKLTKDGTKSRNPESYIQKKSPALYNFLQHHFKDCNIVGMSAQGCDYPDNNTQKEELDAFKRKLVSLTRSGKRAFVEVGDTIIYDLSLPLYMLFH